MSISFENTEIAFQYRSNKELKRAHFLFQFISNPIFTKIGIGLTNVALRLNLPVKALIKKTIFQQFCGGENLKEATVTTSILKKYNVGVALDYGVEGKNEESEFDNAVPEFVKALEYASSQDNIPFIPIKITGFARFSLLEKIHSKQKLDEQEIEEWNRVYHRIDKICSVAYKYNLHILIDAEESWVQDAVDTLANDMMEKYNKERAIIFNTFQMYLHSTFSYLKTSYQKALENNYILGAKIVRGAYMEKERERAHQMNYPNPVHKDKESTDKDYDLAVKFCLDRLSNSEVFIGTHNEYSVMQAIKYMEAKNIHPSHPQVSFSQLYGMSDNITFNLSNAGYKVSKYLPYGPIKDVMPYLMRRAQENTSVAGQTNRELSLIKKELKRRRLR